MDLDKYITKNSNYNKYVAIECGVVSASIFTCLLSFICTNEEMNKGQIAYASSPILKKMYPEFSVTQIRQALMNLKDKNFIEMKTQEKEVENDFDYIITLSEKGREVYAKNSNYRYISSFYKKQKKEAEDEE